MVDPKNTSHADPNISRRAFLGGAGAGALALALPSRSMAEQLIQRSTSKHAKVKPKIGGALRFYDTAPPPSFDPIASPTSLTLTYSAQIFSQLVRVDPTQKDLTKIVGDLAEAWTVSRDGKTYTFHLRTGVKWHDGQPFTAQDVVYSLDYMANPAKSGIAGDFTAYTPGHSGRAVNAHTVDVVLSEPQAGFLSSLSQGFSCILPQHNASANPTSTAFLVGTGPFTISSWDQQTFVVNRNPHYFISGRPYVDQIRISVIPDNNSGLNALASHQLDMSFPWDGITDFQDEQYLLGLRAGLVMEHRNVGRFIVFAGKIAAGSPWKDKRVRQAFNLVLNRQDLITVSAGAKSWSAPGGFGTPGTVWRETPAALEAAHFTRSAPTRADIKQAKSLMAAAGYQNGFAITCLQRNLPYQTASVSEIGSTLQQYLGVTVTSDVEASAVAIDKENSGQFDFVLDGFNIPTGDPDEGFAFFTSKSPQNIWGYSNPAFDKLAKQESEALNVKTRIGLVRQASKLLASDLPVLPLYWQDVGGAWWPSVQGFVLQPSHYTNVSLDTVWLS
jgi:ABC-type transport system substrate-binding protein